VECRVHDVKTFGDPTFDEVTGRFYRVGGPTSRRKRRDARNLLSEIRAGLAISNLREVYKIYIYFI
jgi:hypothetical protein